MSTLEQRSKASSRRGSSIGIQSNPLELGAGEDLASFKIENLVDARVITDEECLVLVTKLKDTRSNEELLITLEILKQPFLFSCDSLEKIVDTTTSVKTRLSIIISLSYRLTDPRTKMDHFIGLFRFSEEKSQVEEAFKFRVQALNGSIFKREVSSNLLSPGGRGGRGRGAAGIGSPGGRGAGRGPGVSPFRTSVTGGEGLSSLSPIVETKAMPLNRDTAPLAQTQPSLLTVFTDLTINSSVTVTPPSSSGVSSRPVDSDDDSDGDGHPMQISFKPFGSAVSTPVKETAVKLESESSVVDVVSSTSGDTVIDNQDNRS